MGAEKIHKRVIEGLGIIQLLLQKEVPQLCGGDLPGSKGEGIVAKRIVHDGVERIAQSVFSLFPVTLFDDGVLPYLSDDGSLAVGLFNGFSYKSESLIRELVRYIEPPSGSSFFQPGLNDRLFPRYDIVLPRGLVFVDIRKIFKSPPAFVIIGKAAECIPFVIGRLLSLTGAFGRVVAVSVEIDAVASGVIENPVEYDMHPHGGSSFAEKGKILLIAQNRIDLQIIRSVVTVVASCLEDRVQVYAADPELFQIGELVGYTSECAAEEIVRSVILFKGTRLPFHFVIEKSVKIRCLSQGAVVFYTVFCSFIIRESETVRKDLIHDCFFEPLRSFEIRQINCQPETGAVYVADIG